MRLDHAGQCFVKVDRFPFFCEKRRHSRNSSRHSQKSLSASSRTTALGPGYPFWELLSTFLMPFSSQSEKVENATAPKREPTFQWSGGSLFRPFSTLDQKTLSQHTFTFFFKRFLHHFGLSGRCPRTNKKKEHQKTSQKHSFGNFRDTPLSDPGPNNTLKIGRWCVWYNAC